MGTQNRLFNQIVDRDQGTIESNRQATILADKLLRCVNKAISFTKENKIENIYFRNPTIYTHDESGDVCLHLVIGSTPRPDRNSRPLDTDVLVKFDVEKQRVRLLWDNIMYNVAGDNEIYKTQANVSFAEYDRLEKSLEKFMADEMHERTTPAARIRLAKAKCADDCAVQLPSLPYYC